MELGWLASSRLHDNIEALFDERLDTSGRKRHTTFTLENFFGYANCQLFIWNTCKGEEKNTGATVISDMLY